MVGEVTRDSVIYFLSYRKHTHTRRVWAHTTGHAPRVRVLSSRFDCASADAASLWALCTAAHPRASWIPPRSAPTCVIPRRALFTFYVLTVPRVARREEDDELELEVVGFGTIGDHSARTTTTTRFYRAIEREGETRCAIAWGSLYASCRRRRFA